MRKLLAVLLFAFAFSGSAETLKEFDARIKRELAAKDATVLPLWKQANAAREAERHEEAIALYAQVYARVPSFVHALRRQAGEEMRANRRADALSHAREAVALERSASNLATLAMILIEGNAAEIDEGAQLAREAANLEPANVFAQVVLGRAGEQKEDLSMIRDAAARLENIAPDEVQTHMYRMTVAVNDGDWSVARAALDRARQAGLAPNDYDTAADWLTSVTPFYVRWWKPALIAFVAWFGGFGLMLLAGAVLSRMAMRAAKTVDGLSARVRRIYAIVLGLSCAFYYASVPVVIAFVLAFTGGLIYATFVLGQIPVKIVLILVVVGGVSVWSMIKSLFVRPADEDPGARLDLSAEPKLRALLDGVAAKIGTHPVDNVYLTPGTEIAVMERGKGRQKERCLILGVAVLEGMKIRPLKSILGHEYGHFVNRDTAGGAFALSVRRSLSLTAIGIAQGGVATWYNPAWWFVNGFHRLFLRISEGASRLQEVLADRWSVAAYGADAFEEGMRHAVERDVRFDAHVGVTLKEVVDGKLPLTNLYTYRPAASAGEDVAQQVEEALNRPSSVYDSHPAPAERFALIRMVPARAAQPEPDDDEPATSLFTNFEALQFQMTAQVRENVKANYGVEIAAVAPASAT